MGQITWRWRCDKQTIEINFAHFWSTEEKDSDEDEETELLQSTTALVGERSKKELSQDGVFLTRCKDANQREPSKVGLMRTPN